MCRAECISRFSGVRYIFDMGDFRAHDAPCLNSDRILDRHSVCKQFNVADTVFDIGPLKALIRIGERCVDFLLDRARLIDQIHQFADQNISFFVHQVIALFCKCQRILRQH